MPNERAKTKLGIPKFAEEPNMSDTTLLVTVEELINQAMGPPNTNIVNFKIVQLILEILARQQRILLQKIEIGIADLKDEKTKGKRASSISSLAKSPPRVKSLGVVIHESKILKRHNRKDAATALKEYSSTENIEQQVNILTDEKEISKGTIEKRVEEDEEVQEENETKEQVKQDEFQKIAQIKQDILEEAHEEEDDYDIDDEVLLTKEQEALEEKFREESFEKEAGETVEYVRAKKNSKTEHKLLENEQIHKKEHHKKIEKVSQTGSEVINTEVKENKERMEAEKVSQKEHIIAAKEKVVPKNRSDTSRIKITEKQIDTEKILVIEKGPSTRSETRSSSTIDYVTTSQLAYLEAAVEELRSIAPPMPIQLAENDKLMSDIMKGIVSLPEAMETLQVNEKIKAAERSMTRIAEILTQLVATRALPEDIAIQVETIIPSLYEERVQSQPLIAKKSVVVHPKATQSHATQSLASHVEELKPSIISEPSMTSSVISRRSTDSKSFADSISTKVPCITHKDMRTYLKDLKDDITNILNRKIDTITEITENAKHINKNVAAKLDVAQKLNSRITALNAILEDYANQFSGFGSILSIQMQNIESQITEMHRILKSGLTQLADANHTAEATALLNLLEHSEELCNVVSAMLYEIKGLMIIQIENKVQMQILKESTKIMREEKANRDEMLERLKYKTDSSSLAGRLSYVDFAAANADFQRRIDHCHEIFQQSIALWAAVIKDLKSKKEMKANLLELLATRESLEHQLQALNNKIRIVAATLGDPQVALNMRKLTVDGNCGSCHEPARMEPVDASSGVPPRLPALRQTRVAMSTGPCISEWIRARSPEPQHIICDRWCGGSHTLVTDPTKRFQLHVQMRAIPTKHFTDYGDDGRLYMCEEALQPCIECNSLGGEKTQDPVRGLPGIKDSIEDISTPRHVASETPAKCSCPKSQMIN